MSITPPDPGLQAALSAIQTGLVGATRNSSDGSFSCSGGVTKWLFPVDNGGSGTVKWVLDTVANAGSSALPCGTPGPTTFAVLQSGTVHGNGIDYNGSRYRLVLRWNGSVPYVDAVTP